jgi:ABC-type Fe3+/spermidine/putrescine transport system ATPase subunit
VTSLRVQALEAAYDDVQVLRGVDLAIDDGEFFFLLGPSGCGKTTLLRAIAGFVEPTRGDVLFGARSMKGVPPAKRDCGMVFQNYALWPHLTVFENVAFGLDVRKVARGEKDRRVREALRLVRMEDFADRTPNRLSGGQQQRVALARALVIEPQVLLLDEPLSNLDAALRVELRAEIHDIQRRTRRTAVYVTHDRAEALALADRIAVMHRGVIEQIGTPGELYERPATAFVAGFVGDVNRLEGRIAARDGDALVVEGPFGAVRGRAPENSAAPGDAVHVLVRPERLRLDAAAPPAMKDARAGGRLAGKVARRTFLGELLQHDVALDGGVTLRVLSLGGSRSFDEGTLVTVVLEDALVFKA